MDHFAGVLFSREGSLDRPAGRSAPRGLFMNGNHIFGFHETGSLYRITLHPEYKKRLAGDEEEVRHERWRRGTKRKRNSSCAREEDCSPDSAKRRRVALAADMKLNIKEITHLRVFDVIHTNCPKIE